METRPDVNTYAGHDFNHGMDLKKHAEISDKKKEKGGLRRNEKEARKPGSSPGERSARTRRNISVFSIVSQRF